MIAEDIFWNLRERVVIHNPLVNDKTNNMIHNLMIYMIDIWREDEN